MGDGKEITNKIKSIPGKTNFRDRMVWRILVVGIASFIMALNINTFVHTGGLLPGGASGLTLLIQEIVKKYLHREIPYTVLNLLINAIPVYIGFRFVGKSSAVSSTVWPSACAF